MVLAGARTADNDIADHMDGWNPVDGVETGTVSLVGSGPGDPDLLTVAGLRELESADLVIADRLVSKEILGLVSDTALCMTSAACTAYFQSALCHRCIMHLTLRLVLIIIVRTASQLPSAYEMITRARCQLSGITQSAVLVADMLHRTSNRR